MQAAEASDDFASIALFVVGNILFLISQHRNNCQMFILHLVNTVIY